MKRAVEDRFGLPRKALVDAFYAMDVAPGQSLSSFVMSVEDKRARLDIDRESCYRTHAPKLERGGLLDLEGPADYAALLVGVSYADFTWDNIVSLA